MPTEADPDGDPDPIDLDFDLDRALRVRAIRAADRLEAITGEPYDAGEALTKGLDLLEAKLERFEPADSNATGTGEGRLIEDGGRDRERPADLPFRLPGQAETFAGPGDGYPSALRGERDG